MCCSCRPSLGQLRFGSYHVPHPSGCDIEHARYHGHHIAGIDEATELQDIVRTLASLAPGSRPVERDMPPVVPVHRRDDRAHPRACGTPRGRPK